MSSPLQPSLQSQQPSQEQLLLAYQTLEERKAKNRLNQANYRNNQKNTISSLQSQVQSLQSQVEALQSQLQQRHSQPLSIFSPPTPNPQLLSQLQSHLQQCRSDLSSRDLTIQQLQQRLSQVEPYGPFLQWLNQTYPTTFQQFNTFQQQHQQSSSISDITNVHLQ
jgi:chromosome segregation ATPase